MPTIPSDFVKPIEGKGWSINRPPPYTWEWCFNNDWYSLTVKCVKAPNPFHRLVQRFILGIHWQRVK